MQSLAFAAGHSWIVARADQPDVIALCNGYPRFAIHLLRMREAPEQRIRWLQAGIEASGREPVGTYTYAILEVDAGCLERFAQLIGGAKDHLPIIACWRDVTGNPNRVIDLWKGDTGRHGYAPNDDRQEAFFGPLRKLLPSPIQSNWLTCGHRLHSQSNMRDMHAL